MKAVRPPHAIAVAALAVAACAPCGTQLARAAAEGDPAKVERLLVDEQDQRACHVAPV